MKVEFIKVLATELGLDEMIDSAILMHRYTKGEMAWTEKGKAEDAEKYTPMLKDQKKLIGMRIAKVMPEFANYPWGFGRLGDGSSYITLYNPEWK